MSDNNPGGKKPGSCPFPSRRGFLAGAGGLVAAASAAPLAAAADASDVAKGISPAGQGPAKTVVEPFYGRHQSGIATQLQNQTFFAAFDLVTTKRDAVIDLLKRWTAAADRLTRGLTAEPLGEDLSVPGKDSGEAIGLAPARLTLTFGFGPGLFVRDGKDRYGVSGQRPAALVDMPKFNGDQLVEERSDGDLSVQACADDPQVVFHATRQLALMADTVARLRWTQTGFNSNFAAEDTPRNLMGFKDGTQNPTARHPVEATAAGTASNPDDFATVVWAGSEGPDWMRDGSYVVFRKIRMALEHWDRTPVDFQEEVIGRHKLSGAPLGGKNEFDPLDLDAEDKDGNPVIPDNAHVRMAAAASNDGAQILRRGFSYNDGTNFTAERWPPWRQGLEYDAGLLFIAYQRDPRTGFIKLFETMAKLDALNQFTTHVASGLFACPGGVAPGEYIGQRLFEPEKA